ncbi:MAG: hypothetical protein IJ397_10125 [Lachnospiraceae bacterium]|nr:hypothetical protein [Lachnospiraceae bacterium]
MSPIGYSRKSIGIFLAVAICVGAGALMAIFVSSGATFSDIKYFGIVAGVLAILCIISDITSNIKNKKKIAHRKIMLSCPKTRGKVVEVKRNPYFFGKELKENLNINPMGKNVVYRIAASVCNPSTGEEVIVTSEPYGRMADSFIKDGYVDVHYSSNGEYWIELSE